LLFVVSPETTEAMSKDENHTFKVTLTENRRFPPSEEFVSHANYSPANYELLVKDAKSDPQGYWSQAALELSWFKPWTKILEWDAPVSKWFLGGNINASYNCMDRHLKTRAQKAAIVWEGEPGEIVVWSYSELHSQVEKMTAALRKLGLKKGDRVAIYMPMIPEAAVAMLACARGGFTHTVIFGGFSSEALKDRIQDAEARLLITADGGYRKGAWLDLKTQADQAAAKCPTIKNVISVKRALAGKLDANLKVESPNLKSKDLDWHSLLAAVARDERKELGFPEELDSEHPLFILYTSGTTGKPKGIVHSTAGYLTGALRSMRLVFDLKEEDLYWCTADIGWVTGHSYLVYGPLAAGASLLIYEGAPTYPTANRFWEIIERHRPSILYTAPTAIRAFMKNGTEGPLSHDLSSLRLLGTVGEPINPEAWMWYRENVGGNRCPIVDTYWQTETGAIVIAAVPGAVSTKPGSATLPLPGYDVDVVDKAGKSVSLGSGGYLVIKKPWPSMARTIHGDADRFKKTYFSEFGGEIYFTGDGARRDEDGYIWCLGRVDDVLNVSGHRLGTMEIESALVSHPLVAEAAVVGRPDDLKGQAIVAFVTLKAFKGSKPTEAELAQYRDQLKAHVTKEIGAIARPDDLRFTESLPKTRSGKIMRRLLRELATEGKVKGDTTTLEDFSVIASLQKDEE
jgi:acetyl-CoA synthetase